MPATYVLIPGAGGDSQYWNWVAPLLRAAANDVIAVDLPAGDDSAGLTDYRDRVRQAASGVSGPLILVAQSMGGLTAPLVAAARPTNLLVLVNAMVPVAGETGAEWWRNTGQARASAEYRRRIGLSRNEFDFVEDLFHDVPEDVKSVVFSSPELRQSDAPFAEPWPLGEWPRCPRGFCSVPTTERFR